MTATSPVADEAPAPRTHGRRWRRLGGLALGVWFLVAVVGIGALSLSHLVPMPRPDDVAARLATGMLALRRGGTEHFVVHVVSAGCSCTDRLFGHLITRPPLAGAEELVLFVGEAADKRAAATRAGRAFATVSAVELSTRYGLEAAPVLLAFDARGRLRYAGGYYDHPAAISPRDATLHAALVTGAMPKALPVFGCAVSPRLQASLDPLGLVYPR